MDKCEDYELVCYNTDNSKIKGKVNQVFIPENVADIKRIIADSADVVPRGMGNNFFGGCVSSNSNVVDMKKMKKIDFDFNNNSVYAGAGISVKELNEKLNSMGYEFPFFDNGTIGGMIAMNVQSLFSAYGNISDWIYEIEFVNGKSEFLKIRKSDFGEVCGLEGITGIIIGAKLKIIPYKKRSASIFQSSDIEEIFLITKKLRNFESIIAVRFYSPLLSKLLGFNDKYNIIIVFNNENGKILGEKYNKLINIIKKDYSTFKREGYSETDDPKFLFEKIKNFVLLLEKFKVPYLVDFIESIVYSYFNDKIKKDEAIKMAKKMSGVSGRLGIGIRRKNLVDDLQKKLVKRIKFRCDPFLKMNKGKYIDNSEMEEYRNLVLKNNETEVKNDWNRRT